MDTCSIVTAWASSSFPSFSLSLSLSLFFLTADINECPYVERAFPDCHQCNNLPGGFACDCRDGYYLSAAALTCYGEYPSLQCQCIKLNFTIILSDVNECAYDNGGCQHQCINSGGSYRCECNCGYILQPDKKSCLPGIGNVNSTSLSFT